MLPRELDHRHSTRARDLRCCRCAGNTGVRIWRPSAHASTCWRSVSMRRFAPALTSGRGHRHAQPETGSSESTMHARVRICAVLAPFERLARGKFVMPDIEAVGLRDYARGSRWKDHMRCKTARRCRFPGHRCECSAQDRREVESTGAYSPASTGFPFPQSVRAWD
jgi:hypothetical protein